MSFEGCSHVTINGGNISVVAGNQHNHGLGTARRGSVHLMDPSEEGQLETLAEYQELKTGNIRLRRMIAESVVDNRGWKKLDACRIIHAATIHGDAKEEEFLHVQYTGPDAVQVYKQDLKAFSAVKDINHVQLFGYSNWNRLPSLVFYDALVPVSHVFERNGFSALLYSYFSYASLKQGIDAETLFRELWIEPRTGTVCQGPYIKDSSSTLFQVWPGTIPALPNNNRPSLNLQAYNNTSLLFHYLTGILPIRNIIDGISRSTRHTQVSPNNQDAKLILSSLPGTIYHRTSREVIARYPGDRERWYYYPWEEWFHVPDAMRENTLVTNDGSVRFMLKLVDIVSLESFVLCYDLLIGVVWDSFVDSWVSQAHGIFSQLGIEEGQWEEYSILHYFNLCFAREWDKEGSHILTGIHPSTPIYLFIRPVPDPDDECGWDDWLGGRVYYWSFDSAGKEEMSEGERRRLGLPMFRTSIEVWHYHWDCDTYNAIEMVNRHEGFDLTSLDLARSLNYQIFEVVGRNTRFEEAEDEDEDSLAINVSVEPAQQSTLPSEFNERMQWIRAYRSLFSGHTRIWSSKDTLCSDRPDITDVD